MPRSALAVAPTVLVIASALVGCGDRAPPALWPEPPPPTLAEPIGVQHGGRAPDPDPKPQPSPQSGAATDWPAETHPEGATATGDAIESEGGDAAPAREAPADVPEPRPRKGAAAETANEPPAR